MSKTATMAEVAQSAGVSQPTASQALGGNPRKYRLSPDTVRRVREAAQSLGYRPNASARAIRAGQFGSVALVLSTSIKRSHLPQRVLQGIWNALSEHDLHLTGAKLPDEKLTDAGFVPRILRELCSDGMLIDYTDHIPPRMIELIENMNQPAIWLNRKQDHDCVYPDDIALGREATQRLLQAGHRRIAYLDWGAGWKQLPEEHYSQRDRQAGYEQAMKKVGLTPRPIRRDDSEANPDEAQTTLRQTIAELLAEKDRPTAFVTYAWPFARRIAAVAASRGLRMPGDLSLVNTGSEDQMELDDGTRVSTAIEPEREYGAASVEALIEKMRDPARRLPPRAIGPARFFEGQTIAPPGAQT
jgi:LacI family transcriptional regulator